MATISEGGTPTQQKGLLYDGQVALGYLQHVTFKRYRQTVLPLDGFIFWLPASTFEVEGAIHYDQTIVQNDEEVFGQSSVYFASQEPVTQFSLDPNKADPTPTLYVATIEDPTGGQFRYAFSSQRKFFSPAGLHHYVGKSIAPAMQTQLIDDPKFLDPTRAVLSNSLPAWLGLNNYVTPFLDWYENQGVAFQKAPPVLYPSKMSPMNLVAPYGTIRIRADDTESWQSAAYIDANRSSWQLCRDRVLVTLFGLQSDEAEDFLQTVLQYSRNGIYIPDVGAVDTFGICNSPCVRDGDRSQEELQTRGMVKSIYFEVSYNQSRVNQISRSIIETVQNTYIIATGVQ